MMSVSIVGQDPFVVTNLGGGVRFFSEGEVVIAHTGSVPDPVGLISTSSSSASLRMWYNSAGYMHKVIIASSRSVMLKRDVYSRHYVLSASSCHDATKFPLPPCADIFAGESSMGNYYCSC